MSSMDISKIRKTLKKSLDDKRYEHTMGVAYTAASLAMKYGVNIEDAFLAGLLHDCAKCMDNDKKLHLCEKHKIPVSAAEKNNPFLLHAKLGRYIAQKKYHVQNEDILNAILNHTTGRPEMSPLEKIIYISDYIEPGRDQTPNLEDIRTVAFQNLNKALLMILTDTLEYLQRSEREIDPRTQETFDYYKGIVE